MAEEKEQMHDENAPDAKRAEGPSSSDHAESSTACAQEDAGENAFGKDEDVREGKDKVSYLAETFG